MSFIKQPTQSATVRRMSQIRSAARFPLVTETVAGSLPADTGIH
jgi:hypothetical protein